VLVGAEVAADTKKEFRGVRREFDRDIRGLERDEAKLITEIKKVAKSGDKKSAGILAKQLVRIRDQKTKMITAKHRANGVEMQVKSMASQAKVAQSMGVATKAVKQMNKQVDIQSVMANMKEFERANMQMDAAGEVMDDALDGIFDDDGTETEEVDSIIAEVTGQQALEKTAELGEIGVGNKTPVGAPVQAEEDDLLARLAQLQAPG